MESGVPKVTGYQKKHEKMLKTLLVAETVTNSLKKFLFSDLVELIDCDSK